MKVVQHVPAGKLVRIKPGAERCDCAEQAEFAPEEQLWTVFRERMIYCPPCATKEGIGPDG